MLCEVRAEVGGVEIEQLLGVNERHRVWIAIGTEDQFAAILGDGKSGPRARADRWMTSDLLKEQVSAQNCSSTTWQSGEKAAAGVPDVAEDYRRECSRQAGEQAKKSRYFSSCADHFDKAFSGAIMFDPRCFFANRLRDGGSIGQLRIASCDERVSDHICGWGLEIFGPTKVDRHHHAVAMSRRGQPLQLVPLLACGEQFEEEQVIEHEAEIFCCVAELIGLGARKRGDAESGVGRGQVRSIAARFAQRRASLADHVISLADGVPNHSPVVPLETSPASPIRAAAQMRYLKRRDLDILRGCKSNLCGVKSIVPEHVTEEPIGADSVAADMMEMKRGNRLVGPRPHGDAKANLAAEIDPATQRPNNRRLRRGKVDGGELAIRREPAKRLILSRTDTGQEQWMTNRRLANRRPEPLLISPP